MNSFEIRQLNIMIDKIKYYRSGLICLSDLIYDLEALFNCLEDKDTDWEVQF